MLLSTAYFPPVEYFALLARYSVVYIEACENYSKQSWRNRCRILTAGGPMDLIVPTVHAGDGSKLPIKQVRIEYTTPWVMRTRRAIASAYSSAPYFAHYSDGLFAILESRPETLWELNMSLTRYFCNKLGLSVDIRETGSYIAPEEAASDDFRYSLHPKKVNTVLADRGLDRPYWQVFRERYGFTEGLSIMDLLFNEGPESMDWLRGSQ